MQAGGRTDPMGCRIFRSKRAAVFETGSGNRSVRNAQYAYGRAAGSRKTMISERMATILPPLTKKSSWRFQNIQCLRSAGRLPDTVAGTAVSQSASYGQHGRACRRWTKYPAGRNFTGTSWCAFLDELPEFSKSTMEVLRQPLEEHQIHLTRAVGSVTYPSDFYFWHL